MGFAEAQAPLHIAEHKTVTTRTIFCSLSALALALLACNSQSPSPSAGQPPAPIKVEGSAFALAGRIEIPKLPVEDHADLHNVITLSKQIISGSEPHGRAALGKLRRMGIRTILSVDGKAPDIAGARALGMRYVHVPIQYKGISADQVASIAKAFRELDGPFYVHCFHGKHRGPAAAAIGRVVLDGTSREVALAEMRQCGTAAKYEGLYRTLAEQMLPTAEQTASYAFKFDAVQRPEGIVDVMVVLTRAKDNLALAEKNGWQPDPAHPDIDGLQEARKMLEAFEAAETLEEFKDGEDDYRRWFSESTTASRRLVEALKHAKTGRRSALSDATANFAIVRNACSACHSEYRN